MSRIAGRLRLGVLAGTLAGVILISGASMLGISLTSEWLEAAGGPQVLGGAWGFDPDDAFYLMAPLAWLGCLAPVLFAGGIVKPVVACVLGIRQLRQHNRSPH